MTNNDVHAFIYMLMMAAVELMVCFIVWLVLSMLGGIILALLFFAFDIGFLAKMAYDREKEERKEREAWEREGVRNGEDKDQ